MVSTSFRPSEVVAVLAAMAACASPISLRPTSSSPEAASSASTFTPPPGILLETTCVTTAHELCFDATDNNCNGLIDEGCGVNSGVIQVAAAWAEEEADVDLLLTDPAGDLAKPGSLTVSGLAKDRDCPGSDRRCRGQNMENVFLEPEAEPLRGVYKVILKLEKTNGARLPIKVRVGARVGPRVYGFSVELGFQGEEKSFEFRL
ncbi:MAG: hypothetical protein RMJ98_00080 [Myxococcales bacterium]|nr:hypothetical protein [Polyangiaceae bacterium]MDW8247683.1 hypothetical protein [Myxococcales bacterium]